MLTVYIPFTPTGYMIYLQGSLILEATSCTLIS